MATSFLRKIILEELKKVLSEEEIDSAELERRRLAQKEADALKRASETPESQQFRDKQLAQLFNSEPETTNSSTQLDLPGQSDLVAKIAKDTKGVPCKNAVDFQARIREKIRIEQPQLTKRVNDGFMGFVTSYIINYVIDYGASKKLDVAGLVKTPLTMNGYKNACTGMTSMQRQKLLRLFDQIPVPTLVKATNLAAEKEQQEQERLLAKLGITAKRYADQPKPVQDLSASKPKRPIGNPIGGNINNVPNQVGDIQVQKADPSIEEENTTIKIFNGKKFVHPLTAVKQGIKIPRWKLSGGALELIQRDYPSLIQESLIAKEIARMLKNL